MSNLTLEQVRKLRIEQIKALQGKTEFSREHNRYVNNTINAIENGRRLGNKQLNELVKQAKTLAGISANELLDFTLGDTKKNNELMQVMDATVLNVYLQNVRQASDKFVGGITIQGVINHSRPIDIQRANKQIFLASIFKRKGNAFYFMTNASKDSKDKFHYVTVQLRNYDSLVFNHTKPPTQKELTNLIKEGQIAFDCDCGRHQFWYRYLATIGKYNFGVDENRYPSTRNPNLTGLACKHVLRVMNHLTSAIFKNYLKSEAKKDIADVTRRNKSHRQTPQQIQKENERQLKALNNWNGKLHNAKKIRKEIKKVQKEIAKKRKKELERNPNVPPPTDVNTYKHCKKQMNAKNLNANIKQAYEQEMQRLEQQWGDLIKGN